MKEKIGWITLDIRKIAVQVTNILKEMEIHCKEMGSSTFVNNTKPFLVISTQ